MSEYVKLVRRNDWGKTAYTLEGKGLSAAGTFGIAGNPDVVMFTPGQTIRALSLLNGEQNGTIKMERSYSPVSDHGHDYSFWEEVPVALFDMGGIETTASLEKLLIRADDLRFQGEQAP